MPLVPLPDLLGSARQGGYGLGYFEAWDAYSLEAVLDAAEAEQAPVILGFGAMMLDRTWLDTGGVELLGALGRTVAERARVPVTLLFNEAQHADQAARAIEAGFTAVMLDTHTWDWHEAVTAVADLVLRAHDAGVAVEGELGSLPDATPGGIDATHSALTDPALAEEFVARTGVDCLAVSVGNVHCLTDGYADIDLQHLSAVGSRVNVPLVIHGGTSFPPAAVPDALRRGVAKFNVGTVLKRRFLDGVCDQVDALTPPVDVHVALGSHKDGDLLLAGQARVTEAVRELLRVYRASGRATDVHLEPEEEATQ